MVKTAAAQAVQADPLAVQVAAPVALQVAARVAGCQAAAVPHQVVACPAHQCPAAEAKVVSLEVVVAHRADKQPATEVAQARADRAATPALAMLPAATYRYQA